MNKLMKKAVTKAGFARMMLAQKTRQVFSNRKGQGALDVAIIVLISVVLAALILAGLYLILNSTVLPTLTQKIKDMFNYAG